MENQDDAPNQEENSESSANNQNLPISLVRRARRLVSQPTLQENNLDNEINNYPQHLNDENDDDDGESSDRLFEEYIQEGSQSGQSQLFDSELPTQHSYLGSTENVRGFSYFEPYKTYEIPFCEHHSLLFPGEILPMIMLADRFFSLSNNEEGVVFGLVFQRENEDEKQTYGVTCQIFEKGLESGLVKIKCKVQQRFVVVKTNNEDSITMRNHGYYAKVKILPEIVLQDPYLLAISNSYLKHYQNTNNKIHLQKFLAASTRWPKFVYDEYSIATVTDKIERYLAMLNIEAPTDPILKSFWLARNVPLNHTDRLKVFQSNCVNKRLMLIGDSLNYMCYFLCKRCKNKISIYNDIFAVSKGAVNVNYCNPAGYIHETLTVMKTFESAVKLVDKPSTEFSWFPGYAWQIAICSKCYTHVGWKFAAVNNRNLKPRTFFGLSCKSLLVQSQQDSVNQNDQEVIDSDME
ncbi:unnamed protein product [Chironomus riparius]|uniref:Protein cereblon n=1 Tax=Chironomus riparius TaxID=315576 RepID=A0A9N9WLU0_9DIPT|nr:unnamed protein product [Chironomus riparius]